MALSSIGRKILPTLQARGRLLQISYRPIDWLSIGRLEHSKTKRFTGPFSPTKLVSCQKLIDGYEVAEAFRHLLAFDLQKTVVHPDIGHAVRVKCASGLRKFV